MLRAMFSPIDYVIIFFVPTQAELSQAEPNQDNLRHRSARCGTQKSYIDCKQTASGKERRFNVKLTDDSHHSRQCCRERPMKR
jgi:hypothetical protein